jgi:hypothetical protein
MNIRCGSCPNRHATVQDVRECHWERDEAIATQRDELAAELRNERYFEDRGYDEARNEEDHEARMGVVPFGMALDASFV